jgi:type II secretory pathway pseudopilin PulG
MSSSLTVRRHRHGRHSDGYVLITLILFVALLAIAMTALAPVIAQQMKRDREEELIHRGVQYSRAIKHYVKKFGRYPTTIEDLESTNNLRFLRKAYKDPVTGKDFKILRLGDVQMSFGPGIAGATSAANLAAQSGAFNGNGSLANTGFGAQGALNANSPQAPGQDGANPDQSQGTPGTTAATTGSSSQSGQATQGNKVFGGGPIVGVASISKDKTIRVFNKKDRYNQWQFIYDPSTDRGGLLTTPNQPGMQSFAGGVQQGIPGTPAGQPNSAFPQQGSPFGFQGGPQMSPGGMQPGIGMQPGVGMQPGGGMQPAPSQQPMPQPQLPPDQAPQ